MTTIEIQETKVFWDKTADQLYVWDRTSKSWELFFVAADLVPASGGTMTGALELPNIGINTAPDDTNKFALKSSAALFDNTGAGVRVKLNKKAAADTGSFLFQTNYTGRAEIGLCGDDNFHFKVSPDGSSWTDAIVINKTTGNIGIGTTTLLQPLTVNGNVLFGAFNPTYPGRLNITSAVGNTTATGIVAQNTAANGYIGVDLFNDGGKEGFIGIGGSSAGGMFRNAFGFSTYGTIPITFGLGGTEKFRLDTSGNVGIGTTSPGAMLDVAGTLHVGGAVTFDSAIATLGINSTADSTNKLSVSSAAVLFNHAGAGMQAKMNKNAAGDTVSTLYQTNWSGRAEVGLCGDDNFHFKISPNGSSWTDALQLDKTTGYAIFASGIAFLPGSAKDPWTNGQVLFEATNDTTVKVKLKGSDGTVRAIALTLA